MHKELILVMVRFVVIVCLMSLVPVASYAKSHAEPVTDSLQLLQQRDSIRQVRLNEVDFIIDNIEHSYVSGRRGISDEAWNNSVDHIKHLSQRFCQYNGEVFYAYKYFGLLTNDYHFAFPDRGAFNRHRVYRKNDLLLPLWVQIWYDGSVYNVKDYSGKIPQNAKIVSVNGGIAEQIAGMNMVISPGEEIYSMAFMNSTTEASPQEWTNFANYIYDATIPPYTVVYIPQDSNQPDTVVLDGMSRQDKYKQFKNSGDKRRSKQERGFPRKPIVYEKVSDSIGVLSINGFWGKRWSHMLLLGKDWRYKRLLRQAMRKIDRQNIKNLVIDISLNSGGMAENVYYTLDYFTDKPIDITQKYLITDTNREQAKLNIKNSPYIELSDREYLIGYIDTLPSRTLFRTDTVREMKYRPKNPKHKFTGNVYVLTGHQTYSAAQMFARYCQVLDIAPVAGQHCGGYNEITGNASKIDLPSGLRLEFMVPFSANIICKDDDPYDYPKVDISIEHPFDEWLKRENHSLDRLIDIIQYKKNCPASLDN